MDNVIYVHTRILYVLIHTHISIHICIGIGTYNYTYIPTYIHINISGRTGRINDFLST